MTHPVPGASPGFCHVKVWTWLRRFIDFGFSIDLKNPPAEGPDIRSSVLSFDEHLSSFVFELTATKF